MGVCKCKLFYFIFLHFDSQMYPSVQDAVMFECFMFGLFVTFFLVSETLGPNEVLKMYN